MKKEKVEKLDEFVIDGNVIICYSGSGNKYTITKDEHCTCKAFSFHRECRHLEQANALGLIDELEEKSQNTGVISHNSSVQKKARINALKAFLTKHNIICDEHMIITIEPRITIQTKPEELLEWAKHDTQAEEIVGAEK
jgi:hypothetical protein